MDEATKEERAIWEIAERERLRLAKELADALMQVTVLRAAVFQAQTVLLVGGSASLGNLQTAQDLMKEAHDILTKALVATSPVASTLD